MLMSKEALTQHVLTTRASRSSCGQRTSRPGSSTAACWPRWSSSLPAGGPTVTSLRCRDSFYTAGGNVSEHSAGSAVDIAKINGIPIVGHQARPR